SRRPGGPFPRPRPAPPPPPFPADAQRASEPPLGRRRRPALEPVAPPRPRQPRARRAGQAPRDEAWGQADRAQGPADAFFEADDPRVPPHELPGDHAPRQL